ncbi:MAG TPA: tetratricopeptide repeat protein [Chitinophagales bacterium]|nr:tetratricopeptide repeat protein [Chitinophagales bacterium]
MEEHDDDDLPVDIRASVKRFEESVNSQQPVFFDVVTFEYIVNHYEANENWKKAVQVLDYALEQHPYSSLFMVKKAGLLIFYRKYKQALDLLDLAETLDPGDISVQILRSDIYLEKNQHYRSERILKEAIEKCDDQLDREDMLLELADVYEDWDRYDMVFDTLKTVLELNDNNEEALSRMWYCVELAGKQHESIELHKRIIDENPYSYLAWHNLGNAYYELGMFEKAIEAYELVTAINENWDLAYRDCGDAYFQLKQYHKAINQFQKAIEFSKPYEELYFSIGYCYEKLKDLNIARSFYRKATSVDVKYSEAFYRIGETFMKEKLWENAVHFYKKALRLMPENANYLLGIAQSFYNLGEIDPFIFACQSVMALNVKKKTKAHYEKLAGYLIDLGCIEDALQLMDFASLEKGMMTSFPFMRAVCYFKVGNRKEAIAWLEEGLNLNYGKHKLLYKFAPELKSDPLVASVIEHYK